MARRIFKKKKKKFFIFTFFLFFLIIFIILIILYLNSNKKSFFIPEFRKNFYLIPKDKEGEKIKYIDKKSLNQKYSENISINLDDITDLKFTIQYFSSPDYNKVREFYTNLINRRSQILSENDFYIFHIKSEIGDDYYLSYKNFETKKQAFNYCKKFLSDIDRCIIINFKN